MQVGASRSMLLLFEKCGRALRLGPQNHAPLDVLKAPARRLPVRRPRLRIGARCARSAYASPELARCLRNPGPALSRFRLEPSTAHIPFRFNPRPNIFAGARWGLTAHLAPWRSALCRSAAQPPRNESSYLLKPLTNLG